MEFKKFRNAVQKQFNDMCKDSERLFRVNVDSDALWNMYLDSFPEGTNEIFRKRREHDCSCCRSFIRNIGGVVAVKNGKVHSIWDVQNANISDTYKIVSKALSDYVKAHEIENVYMHNDGKVGTEYSNEKTENDKVIRWEHFQVVLPEMCVNKTRYSLESVMADFRDTRNVFKRALDEFSLDAVDTVLELIASNSLYKGEEWRHALKEFRKYKVEYNKLNTEEEKSIYAWEKSLKAGKAVGRIRNHSMGVMLKDISDNVSLDVAVAKYERIVAPENYKRPKAIFTKKMLEDAQHKIEELGFMSSLARRFARLDDVSVNDVLFVDRETSSKLKDGPADVFSALMKQTTNPVKQFSKVERISASDFIRNVLPNAEGLEVFVENGHIGNLMSLIAPENATAKSMFKWGNNFSWAYNGNVTDSMKERVKQAGGKVDGDLRFSIQWNEEDKDNCDMDAHCLEPDGNEIYFSRKRSNKTKGELDVDIIDPDHKVAVENITWQNRRTMIPGTYLFFVEQYSGQGVKGFRAEIEFDGKIIKFDYNRPTRSKERVKVAEVTLDTHGNFTVKELLPSSESSREVWGISTNEFVPVKLVCYSPNYWGTRAEDTELTGTGNRHLFFMLKDVVNENLPNGMFNEFLIDELMAHKRVFEALGSQCRVKEDAEQLSGLGFAMTKRAEVVVKVKGKTERVMRVCF